MKLNVDEHDSYRKLVKKLVERKGEDSLSACTEFAVTSGVSVFVIYYYLAEIIGFNDELVSRMKGVSKFYGYTKIIAENPTVDLAQFTERK